jgi:hypothetical protein
MNDIDTNIKNINIEKPKQKRIISQSLKWITINKDKDKNNPSELELLRKYNENNYLINHQDKYSLIIRQIQKKINGYKSQDILKKIYSTEEFVSLSIVIQYLCDSEMKCYYCKEDIYILYDNVREPKQWSLERIYNNLGHNVNNVVISCLSCNLKRGCIYHERFLFTKQLNIIKK